MSRNKVSEYVINIDANGDIVYIHDDELAEALSGLGEVETHRASDVEFNNDTGKWEADMHKSGYEVVLTGFDRRSDALAAEREFLEVNVL